MTDWMTPERLAYLRCELGKGDTFRGLRVEAAHALERLERERDEALARVAEFRQIKAPAVDSEQEVARCAGAPQPRPIKEGAPTPVSTASGPVDAQGQESGTGMHPQGAEQPVSPSDLALTRRAERAEAELVDIRMLCGDQLSWARELPRPHFESGGALAAARAVVEALEDAEIGRALDIAEESTPKEWSDD